MQVYNVIFMVMLRIRYGQGGAGGSWNENGGNLTECSTLH